MPEWIPAEWLMAVGCEVHRLLLEPGARETFAAMHAAWRVEQERQRRALEDWKRRRQEYFTQTVTSEPRLQDKQAGAPGDGYVFTEFRWGRWPGHLINGWCPPDLCPWTEPKVHEILCFSQASKEYGGGDSGHVLTLPEKYVLCGAIHDAVCTGAEPVVADGPVDDLDDYKRTVGFLAVKSGVQRLQELDRSMVEVFLADVKKHLMAEVGTAADGDKWYPAKHYARYSISANTLRQAAHDGRIRKRKGNGNRNEYPEADVRQLWPHLLA